MTDNKTELTNDKTGAPVTPDAAQSEPNEQQASTISEYAEPVPEVVVPPELPGDRLAARRNELRWSIEDAASKLKLAPRQILALEANDFASLPGMAIVRGFIRSYAKLLELDPAPLVEMIASEPNPAFDPMVLRRPLPSMGFPGRRYASGISHRGNAARRMTGLAVLVLIFLLMLAFAGQQMGWVPPLPFLTMSATEPPAATEEVLITEPVAEPNPELPKAATPATSLAANVAAATSLSPALIPNALIDPLQALEIKLREDAWVEISNQNGVKLISRMMRAGSTEKFEIKEPVVLIIGNASGVDVRLRGQSLNLKAVARDNVSKLSIK